MVHLQREILRRELEAYERRHCSPLLAEAGRLLERLTEGRFVALRPGVDDGDRSLVVVRADDEELSTGQLSEGTADQLFLALWLAGLAGRAGGGAVGVVALELPASLEVVRHPDVVRAEAAPVSVSRSAAVSRVDGPDLGAVRVWARANGHAVGDRGRIPAEVLDAYLQRS